MRIELKRGINGTYVLKDTYDNDLEGLSATLNYLDLHKENQKKTLILTDLSGREKEVEKLYLEVACLLAEKKINRLIGIGSKILSYKAHFDLETEFFATVDDFLSNIPRFEREMIVVKGTSEFDLGLIAKRLDYRTHGTVLEVNFNALEHNLNQYKDLLSVHTKLMVMVKANAYGSGLLEVANFLQSQEVDQLGVAYVDEAILLRKNGIQIPIMIMNPYVESFNDFVKYDLQAEIFSLRHLDNLINDTSEEVSIHIKIDTGMHRLGFSEENMGELVRKLRDNPRIKVTGILTHLSSAEDQNEDEYTRQQVAQFEQIYSSLIEELGYAPDKHVCNSSGITRWPEYHFDMVRLGIGLYGHDPSHKLKLKPISNLKARISQIQNLKKGATVGYSRKGKLSRDSRIAILPIGYEDGYLRVFGNGKGKVMAGDKLCPTVGNICMDMTMIDVTDINVSEGDEVTIFGNNPSIQSLGEWADTIPYEILTNISDRVKRVFISN